MTDDGLRAALAACTGSERRVLAGAVCGLRDRNAVGYPRLAAVWAELAALACEVTAEHDAALSALDFCPGVTVLDVESPGEDG